MTTTCTSSSHRFLLICCLLALSLLLSCSGGFANLRDCERSCTGDGWRPRGKCKDLGNGYECIIASEEVAGSNGR